MEFEVVSFIPIDDSAWYHGVRAVADVFVRYGEIDIHGYRIMEKANGPLFVAAPRHTGSSGAKSATIIFNKRDKYDDFRTSIVEQYQEEFGE